MKVLVVLVLAVFTGCNANLFSADEPKSKLDELTDAFWGSVNKARRTADDTLDKFMQTEIGQNVGARLAEGAHAASTYAEIAWDQLPTTVKDSMGSVGMLLYGISVQADEGLTTFKKKIEPFVERVAPVAEKVQSLLTQRAEQVAEVASPYVDKLIEKLDPMTQDVQTRLTNLFDSFDKTNLGAMRVLVVLVLIVFTGCNGNLLYADKSKSKMDGLIDAYWDYVRNTVRFVKESFEVIEQTEFGKDLSGCLGEGAKLAEIYADTAWDQLSPETKDKFTAIIIVAGEIGSQVQLGMYTVKKQLESTVEKMAPLAEQVTITLTARAEQLTDMASPYAERLKEKLEPVIHNMKTHLNALYQSTVKTN
ncbi:apolipoprotein Eb [Labrus bergylta]|uniref:apolipoprotein Eb n=1 Tax=Labrus bergylta TaxID=56723 RepID=UPI0010FAE78F|nr:apolipoprotein Eb-like [Labrus bergylta]